MTQMASSLPNAQPSALLRRLDSSTCEFFGSIDSNGVVNFYTVQMAGWGNDGSSSDCAFGVLYQVQTQCRAKLDNFTCVQIHENLHDTQVSFRMNKATVSQPECVTEGLRLASQDYRDEQTIECLCLANCWPSETTS
ncbi:hypothetical protein F5Y19DRAFT_479410 [Xylariaceae sp. FL1651]|nr:hypothetical protein F5Y19DRAFT_479410 [Xylariaceae sp. FL1651]